MGSCAAPSAKGDDKFITTDYLQQCQFSNIGDEPAGLLGTDTGMSPTEYIMQALAGCYTATLTMMAAEKGIDLDGIELDLNFDINLNGFLGLDSNVRKGAKSIRVDVHLTSKTASREELEALVSEMQKNSPIHDTLANPVEMITRLA
jgi:putative redox protein